MCLKVDLCLHMQKFSRGYWLSDNDIWRRCRTVTTNENAQKLATPSIRLPGHGSVALLSQNEHEQKKNVYDEQNLHFCENAPRFSEWLQTHPGLSCDFDSQGFFSLPRSSQ